MPRFKIPAGSVTFGYGSLVGGGFSSYMREVTAQAGLAGEGIQPRYRARAQQSVSGRIFSSATLTAMSAVPEGQRRPRILAWAHYCGPDLGSEQGAGWIWARMLAGIGPTVVLTRDYPPETERIRRALSALPPGEDLTVLFVDTPLRIRRWLGYPNVFPMKHIQYVIWQILAFRETRRLKRTQRFDLVWHLTWANGWIGSFASLVGIPFVYGPTGGGVGPPWRLVPELGLMPIISEVSRALARGAGRYLNPLSRSSWRFASLILLQNRETRRWLPEGVRSKTVLFPNAVLEPGEITSRGFRIPSRTALFAGKLIHLKGAAFAIRAIALLPDWHLVICGEGPEENRLRRLADKLGMRDRVQFAGWQPRQEVLRRMREEADVFLFPSLHDEGSWVVAEAAASGLPAVCLDRGGPPVLGGIGVKTSTPNETVRRLAEAVRTASTTHVDSVPTDLLSRRRALVEVLERFQLISADSENGPAPASVVSVSPAG